MAANPIRGEVDITLDGQAFVLRPSFEACVAMEQQTGRSLLELAMAADGSALSLDHQAIIVTECVKAWGKATENTAARGVSKARIGELIHGVGVIAVLPRIALVLSAAVTGGVHLDGSPKDDDEGEAMTTGMEPPPAVEPQA
ncbi:MAG: GTA-gp10 family protein [Sphingomonas fennica]